MTSATHRDEFTATLYVGVELSKREWLLTMSAGPGHPVQRARVAPGAVPAITTAVGRATTRLGLPAGVAVRGEIGVGIISRFCAVLQPLEFIPTPFG